MSWYTGWPPDQTAVVAQEQALPTKETFPQANSSLEPAAWTEEREQLVHQNVCLPSDSVGGLAWAVTKMVAC